MQCPRGIIKTANRIVMEDLEDYLRQNIPDKKEQEAKQLLNEQLENSILLRHPILTLGIGDKSRRINAVKEVGDRLMQKYPQMRKTRKKNRQEDDRVIQNVMKVLEIAEKPLQKKEKNRKHKREIKRELVSGVGGAL